jgi:putative spermidine/putrescine transport system permease protein
LSQLTQEQQEQGAGSALRGAGLRSWRRHSAYLGVLPFGILVLVFLVWPTYSVVTGAFQNSGGSFTISTVKTVFTSPSHITAFKNTIELSAITALVGALLGSLMAWAVSSGKPDSFMRRITLSASGVLAQFGGVMLTFAFLATFGFNGFVTTLLTKEFPHSIFAHPGWLYGIGGLCVVYTFFQIPLMFLVFLPAIDNLKPQWREASSGLGGSTSEYWRRIGIPVLVPSFLGAALLLFANSFSAYATAASLISQGSIITPLEISTALSSETGVANAATAKALGLGMVIVVGIVMTLYTLMRRRVSKWEQ